MFLASENIDFTGLAHVFLLGGGERCGYFYEPGLQSGYFSVVTIFPLSGGRSPPYESFTGNTILERKYLAHCKYAKVPIYKISRISFGI